MKAFIISGSLRKESYNTSVARMVGAYITGKGVKVRIMEPSELEMPLYNSDIRLEEFPENVTRLKQSVEENDIIVFVTPEYNRSIPGGLKNAIDWLSAGAKNSLDGKVGVSMGVSTGVHGTLRAQLHLRQILSALGVYMVPSQEVYIGPAGKLFNEQNQLTDEKTTEKIHALIDETIEFAKKLTKNI